VGGGGVKTLIKAKNVCVKYFCFGRVALLNPYRKCYIFTSTLELLDVMHKN
jgi:hypothetical protein